MIRGSWAVEEHRPLRWRQAVACVQVSSGLIILIQSADLHQTRHAQDAQDPQHPDTTADRQTDIQTVKHSTNSLLLKIIVHSMTHRRNEKRMLSDAHESTLTCRWIRTSIRFDKSYHKRYLDQIRFEEVRSASGCDERKLVNDWLDWISD